MTEMELWGHWAFSALCILALFFIWLKGFSPKKPQLGRKTERKWSLWSYIYLPFSIPLHHVPAKMAFIPPLSSYHIPFFSLFLFFFWSGPVEKLFILILASSTHGPLHLSAWAGVVEQSHLEIKQIKKLKIAEWVMRPANWSKHKSPPVTTPPLPTHIWILLWFYCVCIYEPNLLESNTIRLIYKQVLVCCQ